MLQEHNLLSKQQTSSEGYCEAAIATEKNSGAIHEGQAESGKRKEEEEHQRGQCMYVTELGQRKEKECGRREERARRC